MKTVQLTVFLAILISVTPICEQEISEACRPEVKEKNMLVKSITASRYPPLKSTLDKYERRCQNVMNCAQRLECFHGQPMTEIYATSCEPIGQREYEFDELCMLPVLDELYKKSFECTNDFDFSISKNGSIDSESFLDAKSCILVIVKKVCHSAKLRFFKDHYDEIIGLYTTRPSQKNNLCNTPYDKFYAYQFEMMTNEPGELLMDLQVVNVSNSVIDDYLGFCKEIQNIGEEPCLQENTKKEQLSQMCKNLATLISDLRKNFEERPNLLNYQCLHELNFHDFLEAYTQCVTIGESKNCVISVIATDSSCHKDIIAEFIEMKPCPECQMRLFHLAAFLAVFVSVNAICEQEMKESCRPEIREKDKLLKKIISSRYPPMMDTMQKYENRCQNLTNCASRLECFKNETPAKIYEKTCEPIGNKMYVFDEKCLIPVLEELHEKNIEYRILNIEYRISNKNIECTKQYDFRIRDNGSIGSETFINAKSCILEVAKLVCSPAKLRFFTDNYEEIMQMYTTKPKKNKSLCRSPYDKFYEYQFEFLSQEPKYLLMKKKVSDYADEDVEYICDITMNVPINKCLREGSIRTYLELYCYHLQMLLSDLQEMFGTYPNLLTYKCFTNMSLYLLHMSYERCEFYDFEGRVNCIIKAIDNQFSCQVKRFTDQTDTRAEL